MKMSTDDVNKTYVFMINKYSTSETYQTVIFYHSQKS